MRIQGAALAVMLSVWTLAGCQAVPGDEGRRGIAERTEMRAADETAEEAPWSVVYHDGNGNGFRFWKSRGEARARYEYSPVRPETSSSGVYSGGTAKSGVLADASAEVLWRWVRRLEADGAQRADSRMMGTGAFRMEHADGRTRKLLIRDGPLLREFNEFAAAFR